MTEQERIERSHREANDRQAYAACFTDYDASAGKWLLFWWQRFVGRGDVAGREALAEIEHLVDRKWGTPQAVRAGLGA
jgi:hypothetical protein